MGGRNGYFKLDIRNNDVFLKVFPPKDGGKLLDIKEVIAYLKDRNYDIFDKRALNQAVTDKENTNEVHVGTWAGYYENEKVYISVSLDKMLVFCRFYPPSNEGKLVTDKDIVSELKSQRIKIGILKENILKLLKHREYCTNYVIGKGIPPVEGKDGQIKYYFNTELNTKPKMNEDGTVDYRDLDIISHVDQGALLAELIQEVEGKPGKNVFGEEISPRQVEIKRLKYGNNIEITEDQLKIFTQVSGHASLVNGKVFVSNVYDVPADVDNTTGDINFNGTIKIRGNIKAGFRVEATGDIIVEGVVEGANVKAGGKILVKRGIHGMGKGRVEAGGEIVTKNIENSRVHSGDRIQSGSILHSKVTAVNVIVVQGRKGFVSGGLLRAGKLIEAQTIGSNMGAETELEVGADPSVKQQYSDVKSEIVKVKKDLEQIEPILVNFNQKIAKKEKVLPAKVKQIQEYAATFKKKKETLNQYNQELNSLGKKLSESKDARVRVRGTIYSGVKISISDLSMTLKEQRSYSQFLVEKGEIVAKPL